MLNYFFVENDSSVINGDGVANDDSFAGGSGTESDPYLIETPEHLNNVRYFISAHFLQIADIDLGVAPWNEGEGWEPIGGFGYATPFSGIYNGDNYTIKNLYINRPLGGYVGLFAAISGEVQNLNISNASIEAGGSAAILVGIIDEFGKVDNCYVNGTVTGDYNIALLAGFMDQFGFISNSTGSGTVTGETAMALVNYYNPIYFINSFYSLDSIVINGSNHLCIGGLYDFQYQDWINNGKNLNIADYSDYLVPSGDYFEISNVEGLKSLLGFAPVQGLKFRLIDDIDLIDHPGLHIPLFRAEELDGNHHTISNLYLSKHFSRYVGFIGQNRGLVKNISLHYIDVSGKSEVGGIAGMNAGDIEYCFVSGKINAITEAAGGIVGNNMVNISTCFSMASITTGRWGGGIAGHNAWGNINNSYAMGSVMGTGYYVTSGGLIGLNRGSVVNSYSTSFVYPGLETGGLVGFSSGAVTNSYWNTETSGQPTSDGGEGRTTAEMTYPHASNTYVDWDFESIWQADEDASVNDGFPFTYQFSLPELPEYNVSFSVSDMDGNPVENARITLGYLTNPLGEYDFVVNQGGFPWRVTAQGYLPKTGTIIITDYNETIHVVLDELPFNLMVDVDGNAYEAVIIGNQQWITENLKATNYSNGVPIETYSEGVPGWADNTNGAYLWYEHDQYGPYSYGALYNWHAVNNDNGLCPPGWHVASDSEWSQFETFVENDTQYENVAMALKATHGWPSGHNGYDEYGFSALPGGFANLTASFIEGGAVSIWWSATENDDHTSWYRSLYYDHTELFRWESPHNMGYSVRCMREAPQFFAGGSGTQEDPWLIETPEHLNNVRHFIGFNNADKHFRQIADIDLDIPPYNEGEGWVPIGGSDGWFWGHYDGDGHTISNLYINRSTNDYQGLFERNVGTIANLGVIDASVTDHGSRAGILVGVMQVWNEVRGQIINCYTTGSVVSNHQDGRIGGLVGWNDGDIIDSWSSANVTSIGTIVGGLAGAAWGGTFNNVYATGNVTGNYLVGGLVGHMHNAQVHNSFASGNVVNQDSRTGGLVGNIQENSTISGSYASGNVTGGNSFVGGLAGISFPGVEINNSYATGIVDAGNATGAGLVSLMYGTTITSSYAAGHVTGAITGGLVAEKDSLSYVIDSYWDVFTSGLEISDGGQGLPTHEMIQQLSFENWDFNQVWSIEEDESYPWLQWQGEAGAHNYPAFQTFYITATASPFTGGTINGVPQYTGTYQDGEEVTLLAEANEGYGFVGWVDGTTPVSDDAEYTFTATGNRSLVAWFDTQSVSVIATANPPEGGNVFGSGIYNPGDPVTLIAEPTPGYHFLNWSEDGVIIDGAGAVYGFIAETNRNLEANFATQYYTIVALANPAHGGDVTGGGDYAHGATVNLDATPAEGYRFVSWKAGNTIVSTQPHYSFEATANKHLVANFVLKSYTVNLQSHPYNNLGGSVAGGGTYPHGTEISIVASPNVNYDFGSWTENGAVISENNVYSFIVTADRNLVAYFDGNIYEITVDVQPEATGTVSGAGFYYHGEEVALQANAAPGHYFVRWMHGDDQVSVNSTYLFSAMQDRQLTAEFAVQWDNTKENKENPVLITASVQPEAIGVVLGQGYYEPGEMVTLEASPNVGISFTGWQNEDGEFIFDDDNQLVGTIYTFVADTNRSLTAIFDGEMLTVDVLAAPNEAGSVSVSGNGSFYYGDFAQLNAMANTGYVFEKWTIGHDGQQVSVNPNYGFTVTENITLVAHFVSQDNLVLTLAAIPEEGGEVTGDGSYLPNTEVSIEATPNQGYTFQYWSNGDELFSWEPDTSFILQSNMMLEAHFLINTYNITASVSPAGTGIVTGAGSYEHGGQVTLTAVPAAGYHFVKWMENGSDVVDDDGEPQGSPYVFAAQQNRTLEAIFALNVYSLTVMASPEEGGVVSGAGEYQHMEEVTLTAQANEGYEFMYWTEHGEQISGAQEEYSFNIITNRELVAHFLFLIETFQVVFEVLDEDGAAIDDAVITFNGTAYAAGQYNLGEFEPGTYEYMVQREGFLDAEGSVEITDEDVTVVVTMISDEEPLFTLTFEVLDENEQAIPDATITLDGTAYEPGMYVFTDLEAGIYSYEVEKDGYFTVSDELELTGDLNISVILYDDDTSVKLITGSDLHMYPNPASDNVTIISGISMNRITITDITGKSLQNINVNQKQAYISLEGLETGIYLVRAYYNDGVVVRKLQVNR